jgi:hypothetical protein
VRTGAWGLIIIRSGGHRQGRVTSVFPGGDRCSTRLGRVIVGAFVVFGDVPPAVSTKTMPLLELFAIHAAVAIANCDVDEARRLPDTGPQRPA